MWLKKMIKIFLWFSVVVANAQIHDPVKWSTAVQKKSANEYLLITTAKVDKGWHIYSQNIPAGGPISTYFDYSKSGVKLIGKTQEPKGETFFDEVFGMKVTYLSGKVVFSQKVTITTPVKSIKATVEFMACDDSTCLPPKVVELNYKLQNNAAVSTSNIIGDPVDFSFYWVLFGLSFLAGLSALFTPCVFPMIPMTVSFFTKQQQNKISGVKKAFIYGVSIVVIYVLLGTLVVSIFGADSLNKLSTSVAFNLLFFGLLLLFAFSFLGAFELVLPSSWATFLDNKADKGGNIGVFFMALALAVVSFSCTGPIVGTALVQAASQGGVGPIVAMLGFSLAIALPFTLFAIFPSWLNSLPKSGGWLNTVKVVLGFIELALAFKFLSNADLVMQWHLLEREMFLSIWIAILLVAFIYLLGKLRLSHDYQAVEKISVFRLIMAIVSLVFAIYLIPGLFGAPTKLVSAYLPPLSYSESPYGLGNQKETMGVTATDNLPKGASLFAPYDIVTFHDYEQGLAYAKKMHKPMLLDFTGRACVNCRKMEQNVWSDERVLKILQNDIVLVSLYVDDRQPLAVPEISSKTNKPYQYIGQKWSDFQEIRYKTNAQPFYVLVDENGKDLNSPIGYIPNATDYLNWLQKGLDVNKNRK